MESVFFNGGMIGKTLDFATTERYVISTTQQRVRPVFVGSQTYGRAGATTTISVPFSLTGGIATFPSAGDVVILTIALGASTTGLMTNPTGYTQLASFAANSTNDSVIYVGYKIMGSVPDTSFPVVSSLSTLNAQAVTVMVWRGVDQTTPIDVTPTTASGTTRTANPPAITPTTTNSTIVVSGAAAYNGTLYPFSSSDLSGFVGGSVNDSYDVTLGTGYYEWTSGTFNPAAFSLTAGGTNTADSWTSVTLALRPALQDVPTYGNYKNSGVWALQSVIDSIYIPKPIEITSSTALVSQTADASRTLTINNNIVGNMMVAVVGNRTDSPPQALPGYTVLVSLGVAGTLRSVSVQYKISTSTTESITWTGAYGALVSLKNARSVGQIGTLATSTNYTVFPIPALSNLNTSGNSAILAGMYFTSGVSATTSPYTLLGDYIAYDLGNTSSSISGSTMTATAGGFGIMYAIEFLA